LPKLWFEKFAEAAGAGAGLLLELHCACAAVGIWAKAMPPNAKPMTLVRMLIVV
jgi:hypothetical protein